MTHRAAASGVVLLAGAAQILWSVVSAASSLVPGSTVVPVSHHAPAGPGVPGLPAVSVRLGPPATIPPVVNGKPSQTSITIGVQRGAVHQPVAVPFETYVARVLGGEAAPNTAPGALEALAIAVRTYATANLGRHRDAGFDLCDQTHCQVMRTASPATERAAQATAGRILIFKGRPASIYYSASCGGRSEVPSAVWPGFDDPPFLPSRRDAACEGEPEWSVDIPAADLTRAFQAAGYRGTLRRLHIESRNRSGRVSRLKLDGLTPDAVSGQGLRAVVGGVLGWQHVKSAAFDLRRRGAVYRFEGHGYGHGVGLCVIGSMKLADRGATAEAILKRYFPGTTIAALP